MSLDSILPNAEEQMAGYSDDDDDSDLSSDIHLLPAAAAAFFENTFDNAGSSSFPIDVSVRHRSL
jgi:hypothetical protein